MVVSEIRLYDDEAKGQLATKADLKVEIANLRAEIIKWIFIFWIGQVGVMFAMVMFFVKH